jgi:hypothetical protein
MNASQEYFLYSLFIMQTIENENPQVLTVAVKLPSGAIEVITNTQDLSSKIEYYKKAYDSTFRLMSNPNIQIVGFMLV